MSARALLPQVNMSHGPGTALDEDLGPCFEEVEEKKGETLGGRPRYGQARCDATAIRELRRFIHDGHPMWTNADSGGRL